MDIHSTGPYKAVISNSIYISTINRNKAIWQGGDSRNRQAVSRFRIGIVVIIQAGILGPSFCVSHKWSKVNDCIVSVSEINAEIVMSNSSTSLLHNLVMYQIRSPSPRVQSRPMELSNIIQTRGSVHPISSNLSDFMLGQVWISLKGRFFLRVSFPGLVLELIYFHFIHLVL